MFPTSQENENLRECAPSRATTNDVETFWEKIFLGGQTPPKGVKNRQNFRRGPNFGPKSAFLGRFSKFKNIADKLRWCEMENFQTGR